ncbi:hypothetical protein [Streptomyces aureus]|uniref:hypothetical protein n=1 Tax=Streptomyces aureus TaxID=193461 RepID=UPI0034073F41
MAARSPLRRACPAGIAGPAPAFTLISQLPLTLSCPEHGLLLQVAYIPSGTFLGWESTGESVQADAAVQAMDRLTHQGLATGRVDLPRRPVHLGLWLRLLRTLLDELNTPVSLLRAAGARTLRRVWAAAGERCAVHHGRDRRLLLGHPHDHLPQHPHRHRHP